MMGDLRVAGPPARIGFLTITLILALVVVGFPAAARADIYVVHTRPPTPGAQVLVEGRFVANTDENGKAAIDAAPGEHRIQLVKGGRDVFNQQVAFDDVINLIEIDVRVVIRPTARTEDTTLGTRQQPDRVSDGGINLGLGMVLAVLLVAVVIVLVVALARRRTGPRLPRRRAAGTEIRGRGGDFDRYEIHETIGSGGVATIFRARDSEDGSEVALKVLDQKWMQDPEMVRKFLSEADALRSVRQVDPAAPVVDVYLSGREGGRPDGVPFIALELLTGENLEERIHRTHGLPERETVGIALQITNALVAMKEAGVVHRDLTPDNIFLVDGDAAVGDVLLAGVPRVVLIDFGVARQEFLARVTMDGSIAGKPPFMSPEQCRGEKVDFKSDLYALGLVIYTMLNGKPPFTGKNPFEVMKAQEEEAPPPLGDGASLALQGLVLSLLEKDPLRRPSSPVEVLERLREVFG